jgi:hypothetical protein
MREDVSNAYTTHIRSVRLMIAIDYRILAYIKTLLTLSKSKKVQIRLDRKNIYM